MNFATKMKGLLSLLALALMTQMGVAQTVIIPGNAYAFQWSGDPDIGLYFSAANSRYEFRDLAGAPEWWCNPINGHTYFRNNIGVGTTTNTIARVEVNGAGIANATIGGLGTLNADGFVGVQGTSDFNSDAALDIAGEEIGLLGMSNGGSTTDNTGVYGFSNGRGVYGMHQSSGYSAALGSANWAVDATGPSNLNGATTITGDVAATGQADFNIVGSNSASAPGPFRINNGGNTTAFDGNEVQAYSGGTATGSNYFIQFYGGKTWLSYNTGEVQIGTASTTGNTSVNGSDLYVDGTESRVGINTTTPGTVLDVQGENELGNVVNSMVNYVGSSDIRAFNGVSNPNVNGGYGYGGQFEGGYRGVYGYGNGLSYSGSVRGVWGSAGGTTGAGARYGVYGNAFGGSTNYGVYASGDMAYTGTLTDVSDARFKANIEDIENASELISQLQPRVYDMKVQEYDYMGFEAGQEYGFVAQELEQVLPLLVKNGVHPGPADENGRHNEPVSFKGVNYIGMIPVIVAAIQEQEVKHEEELKAKDEEIDALNDRLDRVEAMLARLDKDLSACCTSSTSDVSSSSERASLSQNIPNPFNGTTTINYYLPKDAAYATIKVVDMNGSIVKEFNIEGEGFGQVSFVSNELASGNYFYSLFIDGGVVDTKQMNLVK